MFTAVFVVYAGALNHSFITNWDDGEYVVNNPLLSGFSLNTVGRAFTTFFVGNYAPLQILSYMADHSLWGMNPRGFILTNLILHAINGLLLNLLVERVSGSRSSARLAALLFLLHPVQVESVAWISQRKNLLAMLFFLSSLLAYRSHREKGRHWSRDYWTSLFLFLLSLLSKSVTVILPVILIFHDSMERRMTSRPMDRTTLVEKIPFFAAALGMGLLTIQSQAPAITPYHGGGPLSTLWTMLPVLTIDYVKLLLYPHNLSALYLPVIREGVDGAVIVSLVLLSLFVAVGVLLWRRSPVGFFWFLFFWICFVPVSQIVPLVTLMNDRYLYFPLAGLAPLVALPVARSGSRFLSSGLLAVLAALIVWYGFMSHRRVPVWKDSVTLWSDTVGKVPQSLNASIFLLEACWTGGQFSRIPPQLLTDPRMKTVIEEMVCRYLDRKMAFKAQFFLMALSDAFPGFWQSYYFLGRLSHLAGKYGEARQFFQRAMMLNPHPSIMLSIGDTHLAEGDVEGARRLYDAAAKGGGGRGEIRFRELLVASASREQSKSVEIFRQAVAEGFTDRLALAYDPLLEPLRRLPEFVSHLEAIALKRRLQ